MIISEYAEKNSNADENIKKSKKPGEVLAGGVGGNTEPWQLECFEIVHLHLLEPDN